MEKIESVKSLSDWLKRKGIKSTKDVSVPEKLIDQVIGQDEAVRIIRKAAQQKRHVLLIGDPGTGKSMLAQAMSELLPDEELEDILVYPNPDDPHQPKIRVVPAGKGKEIIKAKKEELKELREKEGAFRKFMLIFLFVLVFGVVLYTQNFTYIFWGILLILAGALVFRFISITDKFEKEIPKLLVSHTPGEKPPFVDATGAISGALLGDVRHDPYQSGDMVTPAHERVEPGSIHRAHKGVLFIDEINLLRPESQQSLLTAMQEKKYSITGQSERSAGSLVKTEPVPCDFVLVAAGNLDSVERMHPALRSRVRGYGYEVYMNTLMDDTEENRMKLVRFVAQEVKKDKKIPHFRYDAIAEIIREAQRRAGTRGKLSLRLRELGGLVRAAGDVAREKNKSLVTRRDVMEAKTFAKPLEQQVAERLVKKKWEYNDVINSGAIVGSVNGLAILGADTGMSEYAGLVLRVVAEVTPAQSRDEGRIIATGKLGEIAKEAVQNVSALIKKISGEDIKNYDIHIQFIGTYEGVEGDSASISIATAVVSALEAIEVDMSVAMTGSLSVRGEVLPVGGITPKIEAAIAAGMKKVIIPWGNLKDVLLDEESEKKIEIVPVRNLKEVLEVALSSLSKKKKVFIEKMAKIFDSEIKEDMRRFPDIIDSPQPAPS